MAVNEGRSPEWLVPNQALGALIRAGRPPERAAAMLFRGLREGRFQGRAKLIKTDYTNGCTEHRDHPVPNLVWQLCPLPPIGHSFWTEGNIQVRPPTPAEYTTIDMGGYHVDTGEGIVLPIVTVMGLRLPSYAVLIFGGSLNLTANPGRRKGAGGYAAADEPLVGRMHDLITAGDVSSIHAAAVQVAPDARGSGGHEAKVRRLTERYKKRMV